MYPAAMRNLPDLFYITIVFGVTTIGTMMIIVAILSTGLMRVNLECLEKYSHAFAGIIIAISGLAIKVLGI